MRPTMRLILISILLILCLPLKSSPPNLNTTENVVVGVRMLPIIVLPDFGYTNEEMTIELITGLNSEDVIWKHGEEELRTPEDLIMIFPTPGFWTPYIFGIELKQYKIEIMDYYNFRLE